MPGKRNPQPKNKSQPKKAPARPPPRPQPTRKRERAAMRKVRPGFSGLRSVAAIQALPSDFAAFRIPNQTPMRSSVLKFVDERPFAVTATNNTFALITRSPTRQLWLSKTIPATLAASAYYKRTYTSANKSMIPNNKGESLSMLPMLQLESATATGWSLVSSSPDYVPNYPLAVDSTNGAWFYFPPGGHVFIVELDTTVNLSGGTLTFTFEVCQNFASSNCRTFTVRGGTVSDVLSATVLTTAYPGCHGFIRPVLITCNGDVVGDGEIEEIRIGICTNGVLTLPVAANTGGFPYTPTPFFDPPADTEALKTANAPFADTRVSAASVLFMNETRAFGKEGHVNGLRINCKSATNVFSPSLYSSYDSLYGSTHEKEKYGGPLEKGLYMFSRPDDSSLQFRDWTASPSSAISVVRLDAFDYVDVVRFTDRNNTDDTNITAVVTYHIEWLNTSVLWPTAVQRLPYEAWRQAIASLSEVSHYTENPIHLRDIMRKLGQAIKWAAPIVAPYARQAAFSLARAALL